MDSKDKKELQVLFDDKQIDKAPRDVLALMTEALRVKQRLDVLERVLTGDADLWMRLADTNGRGQAIIVDNALKEVRQQGLELTRLIGDIYSRMEDDEEDDHDDVFTFDS